MKSTGPIASRRVNAASVVVSIWPTRASRATSRSLKRSQLGERVVEGDDLDGDRRAVAVVGKLVVARVGRVEIKVRHSGPVGDRGTSAGDVRVAVAPHVRLEQPEVRRIGLERDHSSRRPDQLCQEQREVADVRAEIEYLHPRTKMLPEQEHLFAFARAVLE
jgi:hypothetical protein